MTHLKTPFFLAIAALVSLTTACGGASSQSAATKFPTRDIQFIIPYAAGGGSDLSVRRLQPVVEKQLGVKLHLVYKTAGNGAEGWRALATAKPDGYTIGNVVLPNITLLMLQGGNPGFKADDFKYIAFTETTPDALAVPKNSKFSDLKGFIDYAKGNPGKVTVAGVGVAGKLSLAEIIKATGIQVTYVPVSGGVGQIVPQLQGGHVDAAVFGSSHVLEHADTIKALGVLQDKPSPSLPGVPTFASLGHSGINRPTSWGVLAPPGTPDAATKKLNAAFEAAVKNSSVQDQLKKSGLDPLTQTPAEAQSYYKQVAQNTADANKIVAQVMK